MMTLKRPTTAKLKAHLAMAAFVAVTAAMLVLTTVGSLSHLTLASDVEMSSQPAAVIQTFAGATSGAAILPGK